VEKRGEDYKCEEKKGLLDSVVKNVVLPFGQRYREAQQKGVEKDARGA